METIVEHKTETVGGKTYPLTITRQIGRQEIIHDGEKILVDSLAIFDSPTGRSLCFTKARLEPVSDEERAANRARIIEVAREVLQRAGIW